MSDETALPDDLVTITEGTQMTSLTWAQINYAVYMEYIRAWKVGRGQGIRKVSLAELQAYERQMNEPRPFRPLGGSDDEGKSKNEEA